MQNDLFEKYSYLLPVQEKALKPDGSGNILAISSSGSSSSIGCAF
jgi:hypothetical protein